MECSHTHSIRRAKYFLAKNVATLRIEYVGLKDVACICRDYTDMMIHAEKWLVVASTGHVFVIIVTVQTAVRTGAFLEKSVVCY
jgi:hypothetical protein